MKLRAPSAITSAARAPRRRMSASLSFVGMGVQPPTPEWGLMISAGRDYLRDYWHIAIIPGLAIVVSAFALNMLGDGLRDALDPRLKQ